MALMMKADLGVLQASLVLCKKSELEGDGRMTAMNSQVESDSEGHERQRTTLDRLIERPSPLDRFRD